MANVSVGSPRLNNRVAIVTGSSSGLGRQIAANFAANGTRLVVCADLKPDRPATDYTGHDDPSLKNELPTHEMVEAAYGQGKAVFVTCDVGDSKSVESLVGEAVKIGGRLDIIVNNAGLAHANLRLHEFDDEIWDRVVRVNLRGVYLGCKYALREFMKQEPNEAGRRGWIINTASVLGYVGSNSGIGAYCASKGAVLNLTRQIAVEYAQDRTHCNAICPGYTRTSMTSPMFDADSSQILAPWGEWGIARDVAKAAVFLASDDAAWVTGVGLPVDGGYLAR